MPTRVHVTLVGNPFINHGVPLLFPTRSLNELRVLLLDSHRHSRDMERDLERDLGREVHKAEWRVKEQKLQEDIKTLRQAAPTGEEGVGRMLGLFRWSRGFEPNP